MIEEEEDQTTLTKRPRIKYKYNIRYFAAYAHYRTKKLYPDYSRNDIHKALTLYFELAGKDLEKGTKINLLNKLGNIYLSKEKREVTMDTETGKIKNTLPINIPETLKMWRENPELRQKRYVRFTNDHSDGYMFRFRYETSRAIYRNKNIYEMQINRTLKKNMIQNIHDKKVDAFIINKEDDFINRYKKIGTNE